MNSQVSAEVPGIFSFWTNSLDLHHGAIVRWNKPEEIFDALIKILHVTFGLTKSILIQSRGAFLNHMMMFFCREIKIVRTTKPGGNPCNNG